MHALTFLRAWNTSCVSPSCREWSCRSHTTWRIFSSDTLECRTSFPSWMGWLRERLLPLIDWEESLEDSRANLSWAFLRHSLASWISIPSSGNRWTCWSSWSDPISLPSMDGDQDRALLLTGNDRSWSCVPSSASVGAPVRASALLVPSLWHRLTSLGSHVLFPALPVNMNSFMFCSESFLTILASIRQSLGLLLSAMGSSPILESLSTSGMVPGLLGASSDAQDSALRAAEDPGKGFFFFHSF